MEVQLTTLAAGVASEKARTFIFYIDILIFGVATVETPKGWANVKLAIDTLTAKILVLCKINQLGLPRKV